VLQAFVYFNHACEDIDTWHVFIGLLLRNSQRHHIPHRDPQYCSIISFAWTVSVQKVALSHYTPWQLHWLRSGFRRLCPYSTRPQLGIRPSLLTCRSRFSSLSVSGLEHASTAITTLAYFLCPRSRGCASFYYVEGFTLWQGVHAGLLFYMTQIMTADGNFGPVSADFFLDRVLPVLYSRFTASPCFHRIT